MRETYIAIAGSGRRWSPNGYDQRAVLRLIDTAARATGVG
jgi:hypothetical protein